MGASNKRERDREGDREREMRPIRWFNFACGANYPYQALKGGYFVFVRGEY